MKKFKLLIAVLLVLLLMVALMTTAYAERNDETIYIDGVEVVNTNSAAVKIATPVLNETETGDANAGTEVSITNLMLIALFIEAIIQTIKPIWDKTAGKITPAEIASMGAGILIAVVAKINFMADIVSITEPVLLYLMYVLTGIALGRGPSFVHDLWIKLKNQNTV